MIKPLIKTDWTKSKFFKPGIGIFLLIIVTAGFWIFNSGGNQSYLLEYRVKPFSVPEQILAVGIKIKPFHRDTLLPKQTFSFIKSVPLLGPKCTDSSNQDLNFLEKDGILKIGPFPRNAKYVDFTYLVQLGRPGKLGVEGALFDDLLVFNGDHVFLFPYVASEKEMRKIGRKIRGISVEAKVDQNWNTVIPYQKTPGETGGKTVMIDQPDWMTFYNLGKSCYVFGKLEKTTLKRKAGGLNILLDPVYKPEFSTELETAIGNLYDFYAGLFGTNLGNYPVVLLRKTPDSKANIIGGVGGKSLGLTLDPGQENNWRSFSHSFYHVFFDSQVRAMNLRFPPNLWFYKGLATYYENLSMDALPETIKTKFGYDSADGFRTLYSRYLYFRLKDPALFTLAPKDEPNLYGGQSEFISYTQGPLIISAIENSAAKTGKKDQLLKYVLQRAEEGVINVDRALQSSLGPYTADFKRKFIDGRDLLPFFGEADQKENPTKVVQKLNDFEYIMFTWFRSEGLAYPIDDLVLLRPENVVEETNRRGLKFTSSELEEQIRGFSPTLFVLLRQHALRADVCGEKNLNDPKLKEKLFAKMENVTAWQNFLKDFLEKCTNDQKKQEQKLK